MNLLVVDVGGTTVKYAIWQEGELICANSYDTPDTWELFKEKLVALNEEYNQSFDGLALSVPGSVVQG